MTPPRPTDAELEILRALWQRGPSTVREVHERLAASKEVQVRYTTTLKQLQVMTDKGLVTRDERERSHVYRAAHRPKPRPRANCSSTCWRAPSAVRRSSSLCGPCRANGLSSEELAELRRLLDEERDD